MTTTFGHDFEATRPAPAADADDRSIREALRVTLLFVIVVLLLLWAGVADAAAMPDSTARAGGPDISPSSSTTLR